MNMSVDAANGVKICAVGLNDPVLQIFVEKRLDPVVDESKVVFCVPDDVEVYLGIDAS